MELTKTLTLQLGPAEYERLAAEARRLGLTPAALARRYVQSGLPADLQTDAEERRRRGLAALARLAELTADLPPVDAVQVARESREELERRSII
ncbi:MAG TPA: hypothetical protein VK066_05325 [Chloroflexota bacterium]|nr:hypothetical protein [Chloroflexota bacterium]